MENKYSAFVALCTAIVLIVSGCAQSTISQSYEQSNEEIQEPEETEAEQLGDTSEDNLVDDAIYYEEAMEGEVDYSRALAKANQEFDEQDATLLINDENELARSLPTKNKEYTVMVYMIGSNLESKLGNASKDLREMEEAGLNYDDINLLVYTGGSRRWTSNVPCDRNSVLDLAHFGGDDGSESNRIVAQTEVSADMGATATLREFVNFCTENYPSDHYALIFWDHGGGPIWGFGSDELFDSDSLTLEEMSAAMDDTIFGTGEDGTLDPNLNRKLDFVGFDACLMGAVENMNLWSKFAKYYVGSEELEPGEGWNYHFLSILNETKDPLAVTEEIVDTYGQYYEEIATDTYNPDVTLSCADLSAMGEVADAIGQLSVSLISALDSGEYNDVQKTISGVKNCGLIEDTKSGGSYSYDLVDLGSLAQNMRGESGKAEAAEALESAVDSLIVKQYTNVEDTYGVTMFYPHANKGQYSKMQREYSKLAIAEEYVSYLGGISARWLSEQSRDWVIGELEVEEKEVADDTEKVEGSDKTVIRYQLNEEQKEEVASAYYSVLLNNDDGSYFPVMQNLQVDISKDGVVEIPTDPSVLCLLTDTGESTVWPFHQLESSGARAVFKSDNASLMNHIFYEYDSFAAQYQPISVVLSVRKDTGEITIQTVNAEEQELVTSAGKDTMTTEGFEGIYYTFRSQSPARNRSGTILPISEWESDSGYTMIQSALDQSFSFESRQISEVEGGSFSVQLVLEDVSGEQYASELFSLSEVDEYTEYEQATESGRIVYAIYDDHAEVINYSGDDLNITVPDVVEGVPVTVIGREAFSKINMGSLDHHNMMQQVILPDTVEEIQADAFRYCAELTSIHMPSSLRTIGDAAFAECMSLGGVEIPAGVTSIGKGAFAYCLILEKVTLPSSIHMVGEGAFLGCENLMSIDMEEREGEKEEEQNTGSGVVVIGDFILSADQKTVLAYACGQTGIVTIPEGVTSIAYGAFCKSKAEEVIFPEGLKDIDNFAFYMTESLKPPVFPASLERIGSYAFGTKTFKIDEDLMAAERQSIHIGANVTQIGQGSFDRFVTRWFTVDENNQNFSAVDGCICNKAEDYLVYLAGSDQLIFSVPDGVVNLDMQLFQMIGYYSTLELSQQNIEIIIPASVTTLLHRDAFYYESRIKMLHCSPGSVAEEFAIESDIDYDYEFSTSFEEHSEETDYGTATYRVYEDHATFVRYEGTDRSLTISSEVLGRPVTTVGDGVNSIQLEYEWGSSPDLSEEERAVQSIYLKEITVPEGVTIISPGAMSAIILEKISLPSTLKIIGNYAIHMGKDSEMPLLPESVEHIGNRFLSCDTEGIFYLPSSLTYIDPEAFERMSGIAEFDFSGGNLDEDAEENTVENLHYSVRNGVLYDQPGTTLLAYPIAGIGEEGVVTIAEGTEVIGAHAFDSNIGLTAIIFPESVTEIENKAFYNCSNLESIDFAAGLISIGNQAFYHCTKLEKIEFPEGLKSIGDGAFSGCELLRSIVLPDSLIRLGLSAFFDCRNLQVEALPESLAVIGSYAFGTNDDINAEGDANARTISLGPNLRSVGNSAFKYLRVTDYEVDEKNPYFSDVDGFLTDLSRTVLIQCPSSRQGTIVVPDTIVRIADDAFWDVTAMTEVVIPDSVTHISRQAFNRWALPDSTGYAFTIRCTEGSYAQEFAIENGISYVAE